jgi:hypothetical protein
LFERKDQVKDPLYILTPVFNPDRWRSRWRLYEDFQRHCEEAGGILYTIEAAFGDRAHVVTTADNPRHIQVRTSHQLWLKENLINVAATRLPPEAKYIAWIDADVTFSRKDWANETIHQLQHYDFVQMWSEFQDLSPDHEIISSLKSCVWHYLNTPEDNDCGNHYYADGTKSKWKGRRGAPGLAWACTREAWDAVGGLIDWGILGAGDSYMFYALIGELGPYLRGRLHPRYREPMLEWQARAMRSIRKNIGVVPGLALHHWHGKKSERKYVTREDILVRHQYNPDVHLRRDRQGVYQLTEHASELRDDLRKYFRNRNEDGVDL